MIIIISLIENLEGEWQLISEPASLETLLELLDPIRNPRLDVQIIFKGNVVPQEMVTNVKVAKLIRHNRAHKETIQ